MVLGVLLVKLIGSDGSFRKLLLEQLDLLLVRENLFNLARALRLHELLPHLQGSVRPPPRGEKPPQIGLESTAGRESKAALDERDAQALVGVKK